LGEDLDRVLGVLTRNAGALDSAFQGLAAQHLPWTFSAWTKTWLDLGLGEGGVLQGGGGGGVERRRGRGPIHDGELPDHRHGQHGASRHQGAACDPRGRLMRLKFLHHAPVLIPAWLRHRTAKLLFSRLA
jgi:hypothetical protein